MTFPAFEGNAMNSLEQKSVIITRQMAIRLFGTNSPLDKTIVIDNTHPCKIGAVVQNIPGNSSINFDFIVPFQVFVHDNVWVNGWSNYGVITRMLLPDNTNLSFLNAQLNQLLLKHSDERNTSTFAIRLTGLI